MYDAGDLELYVGDSVVVRMDPAVFIGRVTSTPRRREPYNTPGSILRKATADDIREQEEHRELAREIRKEAQKLARDYRITNVEFIGCDVALDGNYVEVKYSSEGRLDLKPVARGIEGAFQTRVAMRQFSFIERSGCASGCDTCGQPLCCTVWSGCRSQPLGMRMVKQQGITPSDKIYGACGEIKCCMRYEHEVYKEFKERAPFKNSLVKFQGREGKVVDYSMVQDAVFVQFGPKRSEKELIPLGKLAPENPDVTPADPDQPEDPPPA